MLCPRTYTYACIKQSPEIDQSSSRAAFATGQCTISQLAWLESGIALGRESIIAHMAGRSCSNQPSLTGQTPSKAAKAPSLPDVLKERAARLIGDAGVQNLSHLTNRGCWKYRLISLLPSGSCVDCWDFPTAGTVVVQYSYCTSSVGTTMQVQKRPRRKHQPNVVAAYACRLRQFHKRLPTSDTAPTYTFLTF